ncbi:hypothetical protein AX14_009564 [Amanita brunnescens Koide BX004]|nr:hypothetical protein AX14_009564 [Amanita brunnescens Koide BX004]
MNSKPPTDVAASQSSHPDVVFEDFIFYAGLQREEENNGQKVFSPNPETNIQIEEETRSTSENKTNEEPRGLPAMTPDQQERSEAARALRIASWMSVFFLLTTDIVGPFTAPFAISQVGWVPGIILFIILGILSSYSGILIWALFVRLDSLRYPLKTYADIADRIYGRFACHICNLLQSIQLLISVGGICLALGQSLSQITKGKLCFSVCVTIFVIMGMIIGQVRSLKNFSWFTISIIWINIIMMCISMVIVSRSPPDYAAASQSLGVNPGPVVTQTFASLPLFDKVNGVMNMVLAYAGAMIFPEIMTEMRRPMDFWKCFVLTQIFVVIIYLIYGCFVYAFQGQFTLPLAYQGVSIYAWQTVGNALALVVGMAAMGLYANIAVKIIYITIVEDVLKAPRFMTSKGRFIWIGLVIVYWTIAFIIGSAIPQVQSISGLVAAVGIMQFTYTFPPLLWFGYQVVTDAMIEDKEYRPGSGRKCRIDTWQDWSRWRRGLFGGRWYFKMFNLTLGLASLATACLGMWAAGSVIKSTFANSGAATSFGCAAPV